MYSDEAIAQMRDELAEIPRKAQRLHTGFVQHEFRERRAGEFASHGFIRRLNTLARCTSNVFDLLPPDRREQPSADARHNAEINIQAAFFSAYGAVDNLAWVWVEERRVRRPNGELLPETHVGLRRVNRTVRDSLPPELAGTIATFDQWLDMLEGYRHALAHRIPLYIPPYTVDPRDADRYNLIEGQMYGALARGEMGEADRLKTEMAAMERFTPIIMHSIGEAARPLAFHSQLMANFNTVEELGRLFLEEFTRM